MTRVYNSMVCPADLISLAVFFCISYCIAADSTRLCSHVHSVACDYSEIKFNGVWLSLLATRHKGLEEGGSKAARLRSLPNFKKGQPTNHQFYWRNKNKKKYFQKPFLFVANKLFQPPNRCYHCHFDRSCSSFATKGKVNWKSVFFSRKIVVFWFVSFVTK